MLPSRPDLRKDLPATGLSLRWKAAMGGQQTSAPYLPPMPGYINLAIALGLFALASCGKQQASDNSPQTQSNGAAAAAGMDDELVARLARGDPTLCTDETVHRLVIAQTLAEVDQAAAENYELLLAGGGSLDFLDARMTGADRKAGEVTCSATLPKGYSDKPVRFTYVLRPGPSNSGIKMGQEGQVERWFQLRGAIMAKLAETGLAEAAPPLLPPLSPPEAEIPQPAAPPDSDPEETPANNDAAEPELLPVPPLNEWDGEGR